MKKIISSMVLMGLIIPSFSFGAVAKVPAKIKTPIKKVVIAKPTIVASSSAQILEYLKKRPFYSTTTKDLIIRQSASIATSSLLQDPGLYPITVIRNGLFEEQGNYYIPRCEDESTNTWAEPTQVSYSINPKTGKPQTTITTKNGAMNKTIPYAFMSYVHYATSSNLTQMQKRDMQNVFYMEDESGYTYALNVNVYTYSAVCAKWIEDRNKFANESVVGYSYGLSLFMPVESVVYQIRGKKNILGYDVRTAYEAYPDVRNRAGTIFTKSPFNGTVSNKSVDWGPQNWYTFRKDNNVYYISISSDNPRPHKFIDDLVTYFIK